MIKEMYMETMIIFDRKNVDELIERLTFSDITVISIQFFMSCISELKIENTSLEEKIENYHKLWQNTINSMYAQEMPGQKNRYAVDIEWTPYTIFVAENSNVNLNELFNLSNEDKKFCENVYDKFNVGGELISNYDDKINFILCMLVMPPLLSIGEFYARAYDEHITKAKSILSVVQNNIVNMPQYKCNLGLGLATNFLNQEIYLKYGGMSGLIENPLFIQVREQLIEIQEECGISKKLPKKGICPYCGKAHDIIIEKNDIFFAHLMLLHKDVQAKLVFNIMDEYREMYITTYLDAMLDGVNDLNHVENPKCYILVEGDTEEKAIPYMAIKYRKPLAYRGIKVWNSRTKEKVFMDFEKMIKNNPDAKICVLLDGDAKKQIEDIKRMIKERKDKYSLYYIENGTFEDVIDKEVAVKALNLIYGENTFHRNDFDESKSFIKQVEKKIHTNSSLGKFDKIKFIETVMRLTDSNNVPDIIKDIIDDCYKLVGQ